MILERLCKNQDKWESMARVMGVPEHLIGDVVQDTYLKLHCMDNPDKILYGEDDVNHFYVYLTIRSVFVNFLREGKMQFVSVEDSDCIFLEAREPIDWEHEEGFERLWNKIETSIDELGRYGSKLTKTYFKSDKSMRTMASESGISVTSIFNSIKQYRQYIVELYSEDWEDYVNGDYDKI